MQIRRLEIERFRGIDSLDWIVGGTIACLIGIGDSRKTTILDAIQFTLSPRYYLPLSDTDFYNAEASKGFSITITVGDLPKGIIDEFKHGLNLRGWDSNVGHFAEDDEPDHTFEPVLSVRLRADSTLEPEWRVITERNPDGEYISAGSRAKLGVVRLGERIDEDLTWGKGTALSRATDELNDAMEILRAASRKVCDESGGVSTPGLCDVITKISTASAAVGAGVGENFCAKLDIQRLLDRSSALALHDGDLPLRVAGLATRRLVTLALQKLLVEDGAIVLIDEVEHGLEPFRIRNLIRVLQNEVQAKSGISQVIMTTHSPTAVNELDHHELRVVHAICVGKVKVLPVPAAAIGTQRRCSEALLARRVVVCEGKTELGLCIALEGLWADGEGHRPAHCGVASVLGEGSNVPTYVGDLADLGYGVALFCDSDKPEDMSRDKQLQDKGVLILRWADGMAIEERISADLPPEHFRQMVQLAENLHDASDVHAKVLSQLSEENWAVRDDLAFRTAFGRAAKSREGGWFKQVEAGEQLGSIVCAAIPSMDQGCDLARKLQLLKDWAYKDGPRSRTGESG